MSEYKNDGGPADKTPPNWSQKKDIKQVEGSGEYPNYWVRQTRSGINVIFDDTKDRESLTIQHPSGSTIQFLPDGGVQYISHNGQQNVVFGENRVLITGAQDTTVRKDSSTVTHGECNTTVHKGMNVSCGEQYNVVAKSHNAKYTNQCDVSAKSQSTKITEDGSAEYGGSFTQTTNGGLAFVAKNSGCTMHGKTGVGIQGDTGVCVQSPATVNMIGLGGIFLDARGGEIRLNSGSAKEVADGTVVTQPKPSSSTLIG